MLSNLFSPALKILVIIIKSALERFADKAAERHIDFSTQDNRKYKYHFYGDRLLIDLAFSNIVNNSIKYIGFEGHINIEIYESKEFITIIFEDDGIGIPKEDLEKVTEQFFRASNTNKNQTGSALSINQSGLSIARFTGQPFSGFFFQNFSINTPLFIGLFILLIIQIIYSKKLNKD